MIKSLQNGNKRRQPNKTMKDKLTAKSLRIGNLVNDMGSIPYQIQAIDIVYLQSSENKGKINLDFNPIPLTPEWLERMGFARGEINSWYNLGLFFSMNIQDNKFYFDSMVLPIKYVHQLQNLYFAIKNTELEIEQ